MGLKEEALDWTKVGWREREFWCPLPDALYAPELIRLKLKDELCSEGKLDAKGYLRLSNGLLVYINHSLTSVLYIILCF